METNELKYGFNDGKIGLLNDLIIPVDNLAIGRGYAAYEFFRIHRGRGFYLDRHLNRLFNSLEILKISLAYSLNELENIINQLILKNKTDDFYIKLYAIPQNLGKESKPAHLYILPCSFPAFDPKIYLNGTNLLMKEYSRFLPEAKSTNYIASEFWHDEMAEMKAIDVLFIHGNVLLESSRGNIFIVKNGKIVTPSHHILKGITRSIVIDIMNEQNIPFSIKSISTEELFSADEVFITSTTKLVMPIVKINDKIIGNGLPGNLTKQVSEFYLKVLE